MKITITEIEASTDDLMANRRVADVLTDAISRIADVIARPAERAYTWDTAAEQEGEEE